MINISASLLQESGKLTVRSRHSQVTIGHIIVGNGFTKPPASRPFNPEELSLSRPIGSEPIDLLGVVRGPDPSADLLCQLDDDPLGAADVAEPVAVLVAHQLADQLGAPGS